MESVVFLVKGVCFSHWKVFVFVGKKIWSFLLGVLGFCFVNFSGIFMRTPPKTNKTVENHDFLIGDISSIGCFFIVMLVFRGSE